MRFVSGAIRNPDKICPDRSETMAAQGHSDDAGIDRLPESAFATNLTRASLQLFSARRCSQTVRHVTKRRGPVQLFAPCRDKGDCVLLEDARRSACRNFISTDRSQR